MDLEKLYYLVKDAIDTLDFQKIWPGFKPLRFALYDDEKCFFAGEFIVKTDAFCANTSINFNGEQIAIWKVAQDLEIPVLASKMVHEMLHGYQTVEGWQCWPDEIAALYNYEYVAENLTLKLRENEILLKLLDECDDQLIKELLSIRSCRAKAFPYQFEYETKVEEIEGTANYVEWQVLKQLAPEKAGELINEMRSVMTRPGSMFPIRISCYYTGALLTDALIRYIGYDFETKDRPYIMSILEKENAADSGNILFSGNNEELENVRGVIDSFNKETESIINSALELDEVVLEGPAGLVYVNIYNARHLGNYLTSMFFLMYSTEGGQKMMPGHFVIRMKDEKTIDKAYRWPLEM